MKIIVLLLGVLVIAACSTTQKPQSIITPPSIVKSPDFRGLSAKSCRGGEIIKTPATLKLDKQGRVTDVYGLTVRDKKLASQITTQFKKAKYTPYLQNGVPIAKDLKVVISLKCSK